MSRAEAHTGGAQAHGEPPTVCILAGGRGRRLGQLTDDIPKPMLPVASRPFIEWPLLALRDNGLTRAVVCTGYREEAIQHHLKDGQSLGLSIRYSSDGPLPLGTLGAIRQALPLLDDPVPILYADTLLTLDFAEVIAVHRGDNRMATMTVLQNHGRGDTSNATVREGLVTSYGKDPPPHGADWIDYGFLVINRGVIARSSDSDLAPLLSNLAVTGDLAASIAVHPFREIGSPEALAATESWLLARPTLRASDP